MSDIPAINQFWPTKKFTLCSLFIITKDKLKLKRDLHEKYSVMSKELLASTKMEYDNLWLTIKKCAILQVVDNLHNK